MGLKENLLRGIYAFGFEKPSAIQQRAIIPCTKSELEDEKYEFNKLTDIVKLRGFWKSRTLSRFFLFLRNN